MRNPEEEAGNRTLSIFMPSAIVWIFVLGSKCVHTKLCPCYITHYY